MALQRIGAGLWACFGTPGILEAVESPPPDPSSPSRTPQEDSRLFELLRDQLRGLASANMRRQRPGHTLQTTALLHEVWLKLQSGDEGAAYRSREHFLATAASAMRSVLVDHARRTNSDRRGGGRERLPIDMALEQVEEREVDVLELDDALERLAARDARQASVVELRFFGGLSVAETASVLDVSEATVARAWRLARLWLLAELGDLD